MPQTTLFQITSKRLTLYLEYLLKDLIEKHPYWFSLMTRFDEPKLVERGLKDRFINLYFVRQKLAPPPLNLPEYQSILFTELSLALRRRRKLEHYPYQYLRYIMPDDQTGSFGKTAHRHIIRLSLQIIQAFQNHLARSIFEKQPDQTKPDIIDLNPKLDQSRTLLNLPPDQSQTPQIITKDQLSSLTVNPNQPVTKIKTPPDILTPVAIFDEEPLNLNFPNYDTVSENQTVNQVNKLTILETQEKIAQGKNQPFEWPNISLSEISLAKAEIKPDQANSNQNQIAAADVSAVNQTTVSAVSQIDATKMAEPADQKPDSIKTENKLSIDLAETEDVSIQAKNESDKTAEPQTWQTLSPEQAGQQINLAQINNLLTTLEGHGLITELTVDPEAQNVDGLYLDQNDQSWIFSAIIPQDNSSLNISFKKANQPEPAVTLPLAKVPEFLTANSSNPSTPESITKPNPDLLKLPPATLNIRPEEEITQTENENKNDKNLKTTQLSSRPIPEETEEVASNFNQPDLNQTVEQITTSKVDIDRQNIITNLQAKHKMAEKRQNLGSSGQTAPQSQKQAQFLPRVDLSRQRKQGGKAGSAWWSKALKISGVGLGFNQLIFGVDDSLLYGQYQQVVAWIQHFLT